MSNNTQNPTRQDEEPVASGRPSGDPQDRDGVRPPRGPPGASKEDSLPEGPNLTTPAPAQGGESTQALGDEHPGEERADEGAPADNMSISSWGSSLDGREQRISAQEARAQDRREGRTNSPAAEKVATFPADQQALVLAQAARNLGVLSNQLTQFVSAVLPLLQNQTTNAESRDDSETGRQIQEEQLASVQQVSKPQGNPKNQLGPEPHTPIDPHCTGLPSICALQQGANFVFLQDLNREVLETATLTTVALNAHANSDYERWFDRTPASLDPAVNLIAGDWDSLVAASQAGTFLGSAPDPGRVDVILTAETIYAQPQIEKL
eukprot:g1334.t1